MNAQAYSLQTAWMFWFDTLLVAKGKAEQVKTKNIFFSKQENCLHVVTLVLFFFLSNIKINTSITAELLGCSELP